MQKVFRCSRCSRRMRVVGSTGLEKEVPQPVTCPHCGKRNKVLWPKDNEFRVQKVGTR